MLNKVIILIIFSVIIFGGLGINFLSVNILFFLVSILIASILSIRKSSLKIPRNFFLYLIFLLVITVSLIWAKDKDKSFDFLILFFNGGLFWFIFYNISKKALNLFNLEIILAGLIFGSIFFRSLLLNSFKVNSFDLFSPVWFNSSHIHLGDYWMFCLVLLIYYFTKQGKFRNRFFFLPLLLAGLYFLISSSSRSAILGLIISVFYLFYSNKFFEKHKKISTILLVFFIGIFLFASSIKTSLLSRQYFVQGVIGFFRNPLGVGMGNFYLISNDVKNQMFGFDSVSNFSHNLIIETLSGVGIFATIFIFWLIKIFQDILGNEKNVYTACFIALTVNFMFDFTYVIPTMFCLWFAFLGLSQKRWGGGRGTLSS